MPAQLADCRGAHYGSHLLLLAQEDAGIGACVMLSAVLPFVCIIFCLYATGHMHRGGGLCAGAARAGGGARGRALRDVPRGRRRAGARGAAGLHALGLQRGLRRAMRAHWCALLQALSSTTDRERVATQRWSQRAVHAQWCALLHAPLCSATGSVCVAWTVHGCQLSSCALLCIHPGFNLGCMCPTFGHVNSRSGNGRPRRRARTAGGSGPGDGRRGAVPAVGGQG